MKEYELTVLIHPDLEASLSVAVDKVKKIIADNDGKILNEKNEDKKRLAYAIQKQEFAVYYSFELELPPQAVSKISNILNIADEVLRYLLVSKDERKIKADAKRKESEAKRKNNKEEE
jgi:small subunit ribosomal protein S6